MRMDQSNSLRRTIEDGGIVYGARASTFSPMVIEVFGELGVDFVWLDFEHMGPSPYDSRVFENLSRAAAAGGTELFVRLPSGDPPLIRKVLDAGVRNLLIPRVDSAEEVRRAVEATRFVYEGQPGERGKASGRSSNWGAADGYIQTEDDEVFVGVMIEKTTGVDELDGILSTPELGFAFIGPSDLSVQMGHPGEKTHPEVVDEIQKITEACHKANVPTGVIKTDPDEIEAAVASGHRILRIGGDLSSITTTLGERIRTLRNDS